MGSYAEKIKNLVSKVIEAKLGECVDIPDPVRPPENVNAEYALPCFSFASLFHKSPKDIAHVIAENLPCNDWLEHVSASGPYLNFTIAKNHLFSRVIDDALKSGDTFGHTCSAHSGQILVEYSSPNTNKPLHLGHVRNNVLGMAIVNLLEATGSKVIPASILNDRGIHICKAMVAYRHLGSGGTPHEKGVKGDHFVGDLYVAFDKASKENPEWMEEARLMLRDWENGGASTLQLWETMTRWVIEGFEQTYRRLGSRFSLIQHESQTYLLGKKIVQKGLEKGVFTKKEDGSVWIDLTDSGLDEKTLLRSDGTSLYITQDLGVAVERFEKMDIDQSVYVVGSEQIYHFRVLFEILKRLGFKWFGQCVHLSYGMVYLPEGKMKSREGNVVDADDLMDSMRSLSLAIMEDSHMQIDPDRREAIADAIGLGAIKYYILKFNPQKDIHFDPEKSLSFEGATGAYIQYCHARIRSVLRKAGPGRSLDWDVTRLGEKEEIDLIRNLMYLPESIRSSAADLNPSRLATHLWELAKSFNVFYTRYRILDAGSEELTCARLALAEAVANGLRSGLLILGIEPVEQM